MKLFFFLTAIFLGTRCCSAEDWTTSDGKTYTNVKVIRSDTRSVTILTQDGEVSVPFATLDPAIQKRFTTDVAANAPGSPGASDPDAARKNAIKNAVFIDGLVTYRDPDGALLVDCNAPRVPDPSSNGPSFVPGRNNSFSTYQSTVNSTGNADAAQGRRAHGTIFLLYAGGELHRGDAVRLTGYPVGRHTDPSGTFYAYSPTPP